MLSIYFNSDFFPEFMFKVCFTILPWYLAILCLYLKKISLFFNHELKKTFQLFFLQFLLFSFTSFTFISFNSSFITCSFWALYFILVCCHVAGSGVENERFGGVVAIFWWMITIVIMSILWNSMWYNAYKQARAEGGAEGAWAPAPLHHDAQSALLSRQLLLLLLFFLLNTLLWRPAQSNY